MIKIYHNNRCQKSRLAVKLLEKMGCNFEIVNYLINPITKKTLKTLIKALDMQPIDLVRTNEALWKSEFKGKTLSDDEIINAMLSHPKLIERPIVVAGDKAAMGQFFNHSDEIRDQFKSEGVVIESGAGGKSSWRKA